MNDMVMMQWRHQKACLVPPSKFNNVFIAAFTTANACLKMYNYLEREIGSLRLVNAGWKLTDSVKELVSAQTSFHKSFRVVYDKPPVSWLHDLVSECMFFNAMFLIPCLFLSERLYLTVFFLWSMPFCYLIVFVLFNIVFFFLLERSMSFCYLIVLTILNIFLKGWICIFFKTYDWLTDWFFCINEKMKTS